MELAKEVATVNTFRCYCVSYRMRTFSTPQSAVKGEITKLAIVECVVCVALYIGIGLYFHTFKHLYLAIAIAPFMLFRTDEASEWAVHRNEYIQTRLAQNPKSYEEDLLQNRLWDVLEACVRMLLLVGMFILRPLATLRSFSLQPLTTLRVMPQNWTRQALCTDFAHPPEVVPMEFTKGRKAPLFLLCLRHARRTLRPNRGLNELVACLLACQVGTIFLLPPLLYRISFKATAVVYAPFIWVAHTTVAATLPLKVRLGRIKDGEFEKTRRWLSGFVLAVVGVKVSLSMGWIDLDILKSEFPAQMAAVKALAGGVNMQWWHATLVFDSVLTFCLLWFADAALARLDAQAWSESVVANVIATATFIRATAAVVTMGYAFLVAARQVLSPAVTAAFSL